jgi:hypothetical protein
MLRINETVEARRNGRPRWTLEVEGALRGEWLGELRRSWRRIRALESGASIRVELADISYVDAGGKVLLAEMFRDGVEILTRARRAICAGVATASVTGPGNDRPSWSDRPRCDDGRSAVGVVQA